MRRAAIGSTVLALLGLLTARCGPSASSVADAGGSGGWGGGGWVGWGGGSGGGDSGAADAGTTDGGATDAGGTDAGAADAGATDAGAIDAGPEDGGATDAGFDGGARADGGDSGVSDGGRLPGPIRVLFDAAHKNSVGNADWVIDTDYPDPLPANPTSETQWSGGISSWGFDLHVGGGYRIKQLPPGTALNYGAGGAGDLRNIDVFVSDEPEQPFTAAEQSALMQFARTNGGIFLVSDHLGAKRCTACTEAWQVINDFLQTGAANAFGVICDGTNIATAGLTGSATSSPVSAYFSGGRFGTATGLSFHSGSSVSVTGGNPAAVLVINSSAGGFMAASSITGGGRLVLLGDSSPTDDGTCSGCGASLIDGWAEVSDAAFILNATAWAAHDGS